MSYYVWGSGVSYQLYLQAKSFVDDVSSSSRRMSLEVSHQTRALVASNNDLAMGNIRIADAVSEGFDKLSWALGEISAELSELNASFHWGFSQIIAQLGHMNDTREELVKVAKTPVQTTAYNHFEIARDAFRQGLYQECLEELSKAIDGDHPSSGFRLEWRFHQMLWTLRLGFVDCDFSLIDFAQAEQSFLSAARYAGTDYRQDAARAFQSAGWAAYCQGKMDEALVHTEMATSLAPEMREAHYQAAKVLMAQEEADRAVVILRRLVHEDSDYLLKAAGDGDFQNHEGELSDLISELRRGAHDEAEKAITSANSNVEDFKDAQRT
jgi:tetratricopeptide (TPR) repeat protein